MQAFLKQDGYVGLQSQTDPKAEESEQLLTTLDSPARVSNTIPELASVSQITAPNCIGAALNVASLASQAPKDKDRSNLQQQSSTSFQTSHDSQHDPASWPHQGVYDMDLGSEVEEQDGNENADPNASRGLLAAGVELQPVGKPRQPFGDHEVLFFNHVC